MADSRIPVWAPWDPHGGRGLPLGLGMVTAHLRTCRDGALARRYDVQAPTAPERFLEQLAERPGPGVVLLSNYVWSLALNLELAHRAVTVNPELVFVHGGPSSPGYEEDVAVFFAEHAAIADVIVHGEGERATEDLLDLLELDGVLSVERIVGVAGTTVLDPASGAPVRGEDRARMAELDVLTSPFLSGDLDLDSVDPYATISFESNRGCPYGCTFCDWGSNTKSRIRKFDLDRVEAEMRAVAAHGSPHWMMADANFGIFKRDVELIDRVVAIREEFGVPYAFAISPAKNTTRHLVQIVDRLTRAGIVCYCSLALQSRDEGTLDAIERSNIGSEHYVELARQFRRRRLPLVGDLMLGLPGQTVDTYSDDLQFLLDHEISARTWPAQVLPNAPMNAPEYRERFQIQVGERFLVRSNATISEDDLAAMYRVRHANTTFEQFGLLRHVLRLLQWDHGVRAVDLMRLMIRRSEEDPARYPLLAWVLRYFDVVTAVPFGWTSFYDEVRRFLADEVGVSGSDVETVLAVQRLLVPAPGRTFPDAVDLPHDYVQYYSDAALGLFESGEPVLPDKPLTSFGPGHLEVVADPFGFGSDPAPTREWVRDPSDISNFWLQEHWELDSVLLRNVIPEVANRSIYRSVDLSAIVLEEELDALDADDEGDEGPTPEAVRVGIGVRPRPDA